MSSITPQKRAAIRPPSPPLTDEKGGNKSPYLVSSLVSSASASASAWSVSKRARDSLRLPTPSSSSSSSSSRTTPCKPTNGNALKSYPTPPPSKPIFTNTNLPLQTPPRTPSHRKSSTSFNVDTVPNLPNLPTLPTHLNTILILAKAFDLSISLHLATHPPILPRIPTKSHCDGDGDVDVDGEGFQQIVLENVTTFLGIKDGVEKISGKKFGLNELRRLIWLWEWNGGKEGIEGIEGDDDRGLIGGNTLGNRMDNPFIVSEQSDIKSKSSNTTTTTHASTTHDPTNSPYILTPTRALDSSNRRIHTYGISIRLNLKQSEVLSAGNTLIGSLGVGSSAAVGAVGRWSADGKSRDLEGKLWKWVRIWGCGRETGLPTPTKTPKTNSENQTIPPIPLADLIPLPQSSGNLLPAFTLSSETQKVVFKSVVGGGGGGGGGGDGKPPSHDVEEDVFGPVVALGKPIGLKGPAKPGSVEERRQALYERIKARSNNITLPSTAGRAALQNVSSAEAKNVLKRRSTLSRLEGVAESVWMLFSMSTPTSGTGSPGLSPRARRRAFPMSEVSEIVVKSSKSPISSAEARDSLLLLTQLCPFFLVPRTVARQEWLEMPCPGSQHVESVSVSPGGRELIGPRSPGKVVRGGLREVRERIRRELGE